MSIIKQGKDSLKFLFVIIIGSDQIQIPFVHGFIVGPTSKPNFEFRITLFNKNDFPVLYLPTKLITPILFNFCFVNKSFACFGITNLPFSNNTNGNGVDFGGIYSISSPLLSKLPFSS